MCGTPGRTRTYDPLIKSTLFHAYAELCRMVQGSDIRGIPPGVVLCRIGQNPCPLRCTLSTSLSIGKRGVMPRRKGPRGYSKDAHRDHPGVSISKELRDGKTVMLLRWREALPGGRTGRRKGCYAVMYRDGQPTESVATSRSKAHAHAVAKSKELADERAALKDVSNTKEANPNATWAELLDNHIKHLQRKGRSPATLKSYKQTWPLLESWRGRPTLPKQVEIGDLEDFAAHVGNHYKKKSAHSIKTALVHFKALLNFGRKRVKCVRVSGEDVAEGLQPTRKASVKPVALATPKLREILKQAKAHNGGGMFPLLAFMMVTGCRLGEAEAIRFKPTKPDAEESWIDFDGGMLFIYGKKTSRQRHVPLDRRPYLRAMLEIMRDRTDTDAKPYVFGGKLPLALRDKREVEAVDSAGNRIIGKSGKAALYAVRAKSGADWKAKDLRSTCATYLCNSAIGSNLYDVAGWLGHDYAVLSKHYSKQRTLPPRQQKAATVEGVLGIDKLIESWCKEQSATGGKIIKLKRA